MPTTKPQTIDDLCAILAMKGITFARDGNVIIVSGSLNLGSLTTLPENVTLSAGGYLYLGSLTTLPENTTLSAGGYLDLGRLTTLPENTTLSAGDYLDLGSLTTLPENVTLSAGGPLNLGGLTALPENTTLSAGGSLYLRSLTTLPENATLSAGGSLYLSGLTDENQVYGGKKIRIRTVDGICTRLLSKRKVGDCTLWSAQYFKGHLDTDPRCYVAQSGEDYAHGDTAEQALRDLRFKIAQADFKIDDLVATIRKRQTVTFNDYRLITGACESGLSEGLRARGIDPLTEQLPLAEVLELCRDGYGGGAFRRALNAS